MSYPAVVVGQKIRFDGDRRSYTVQAVSESGRFVALTQPFLLKGTVLYTVIDFALGIRGTDNYGGLGYETPAECAEAMEAFENTVKQERGEALPDHALTAEISYRNWVWLRFTAKQVDKCTQVMLPELARTMEEAPPRYRNDFAPRSTTPEIPA